MMFRGGSRGSSRGRGGSRGSDRSRGRGRGASVDDHAAKRFQVPAFPVVSRPATPAIGNADGEDDTPPVAVSARRSEVVEGSGFVPPAPQRGGRSGRGGRSETQRNSRPSFSSGQVSSSKSSATPASVPDGETAPATGQHAVPTRVITTVTDSGTELPKKLNTKVFIDGLPYQYTAEPGKPSLEDEMIQFALAWKVGKPLRLIKRPGQGFGFLVLQSPNSVATAVRVLNGRKFLGRSLRVEEPKPKDFEAMKDVGAMKDIGKDSFTRQVLLTDLAKVAQPEIIREVLRDVAPRLEEKLEAIKMTSNNRKAFLTFGAAEDVAPAINLLNGFHLLGRRISASQAAAPGSLPYSRGGASPVGADVHKPRPAAVASAEKAVGASTDDEDGDLTVVPLGLQVNSPAAKSHASIASTTRDKAAPATTATPGSNVTGRTDRYNLLDDGPKEIYVGNISEDVTESQLRQHFAPCGKINQCNLIVHPETHLSVGIARIEFALPAYAAYALEHYHGSRLRGCVLRVDRGEDSSPPLASELPAEEEEDVYDEEAYLARYGVKDKQSYFKGTSVGAEMGIADDSDDDDDAPQGRKRRRDVKEAGKGSKRTRGKFSAVPDGDDDEDDNDVGLMVSGALDDDSEEEHFYDADDSTVAPQTRTALSQRSAKKSSGKQKKATDTSKAAKKSSASKKKGRR